jgi:hypothetical protein
MCHTDKDQKLERNKRPKNSSSKPVSVGAVEKGKFPRTIKNLKQQVLVTIAHTYHKHYLLYRKHPKLSGDSAGHSRAASKKALHSLNIKRNTVLL